VDDISLKYLLCLLILFRHWAILTRRHFRSIGYKIGVSRDLGVLGDTGGFREYRMLEIWGSLIDGLTSHVTNTQSTRNPSTTHISIIFILISSIYLSYQGGGDYRGIGVLKY
jgi:hypothetical protein